MNRPSEVATLLRELGDTADEVANSLKVKGIQGVRNTVRRLNPIIRYIESKVSDAWNVNVTTGDTLRMDFRDGGKVEVGLPQAVRRFLKAFNSGAYSELELPPPKGP